MQTVTILLDKEFIYQYVTTLTGNLGRQRDDYEKYVCLPDNYPALDRFFDTAIAVVEASLWRRLRTTYGTNLRYNDGNLSVYIKADSLPGHLTGALETNTRLAMAYILAGMWLQGIDADLYKVYSSMADEYINAVSVIASQKDFSSFNYEQPSPDTVSAASQAGKTGTTDTIQDTVPAASPAGKTGASDTIPDSVPVGFAHGNTGEPPREDNCINRPSELDGSLTWPDGTIVNL